MARKSTLNELSGRVIDYLIDRRGLTQIQIAEALGVDKSFVSRVRGRTRDLSPGHLERLAELLGVDLGVMLIDVSRPRRPVSPERQEIFDLSARLINMATANLARVQTRRSEQ